MAGDPPHMDIEGTLRLLANGLTALDQKVTGITELSPEQMAQLRANRVAETVDDYEEKLSPWTKVWKALAVIAAVAGTIFGAGVAYQKIIGDNATKTDIETHVTDDLDPVVDEVKAIKTELEPVKTGVESLVKTQNDEREFKKIKRKLDKLDKQHQEALQEYTADKAAGRRTGPRPKKDKPHIDLEEELIEAEKKL
jgi:uncharacterized protein YoxC